MQKVEARKVDVRKQSSARTERAPSQRQPMAQLEARETPAGLASAMDASPAMAVQRTLADMVGGSGRQAMQRKLMDGIHNSRRQVAQGKFLESMLSGGSAGVAQMVNDEESLQGTSTGATSASVESSSAAGAHGTGLPSRLKSGIESLSGMSMDHVKVSYNSSQPARLNALAYAQGSDIHIGPGHERHLPHEAWHVVQQAQGRVKPTMQMKDGIAVNDDRGLEHEADVMGARAMRMKAGMADARPAPASPIQSKSLQLMKKTDLKVFQSAFVNQYLMVKDWNRERLDELTGWAASYKQITSILGKVMPYSDWNAIKVAYPDGKELKSKIGMPDQELNPEGTPKGGKPSVEKLRGYAYYWGKKANPVSQDQNLKTLIANQRKYEMIISKVNKEDGASNMDKHRTMGIELEFAQYGGIDLGAHRELAVSNDSILQSVPVGWVLETDDNKKLEISVPPMYVVDMETGEINIKVITAVRGIVKTALEAARDHFKDGGLVNDFVTGMPNYGLGKNWSRKPELVNLAFKGRTSVRGFGKEDVSQDLGLHSGSEPRKFMYEQINLSMTAKEIAKDVEKQKGHESQLRPRSYDWLGVLAGTIHAYLDIQMKDKGLSSAKVLMSKCLAGIGALPDVLTPNYDGVDSFVKEIFGIWVKDNTPNLVVSAAKGSKAGMEQLGGFTNNVKRRNRPNRAARHAADMSAMIVAALEAAREENNGAKIKGAEKSAIKNEVMKTLLNIHNLIPTNAWISNPVDIHYGGENFEGGNAGLGVRKDTFVNIGSGEKRKLHLAEIRSDWTIDRFTSDHAK